MPRILKPGDIIASDEVYTLPDIPFEQKPHPAADSQELLQSTDGFSQQTEDGQAKILLQARQKAQEQAEIRAQETARQESNERARQREEQAKIYYETTLRKAREDADALLARSKEQAKQESEHILQLALQEAEAVKEQIHRQAYQDAYQDTLAHKTQEIDQTVADTRRALAAMQEQYTAFTEEYEEQLRWFALEIAAKIMRKRIAEDDIFMLELVKGAMDTVKQAEWITVQLSDQMTGLISALEEYLEAGKGKITARAEIVPGEHEPESCIIETPDGILDASVATQLENLKESFQ